MVRKRWRVLAVVLVLIAGSLPVSYDNAMIAATGVALLVVALRLSTIRVPGWIAIGSAWVPLLLTLRAAAGASMWSAELTSRSSLRDNAAAYVDPFRALASSAAETSAILVVVLFAALMESILCAASGAGAARGRRGLMIGIASTGVIVAALVALRSMMPGRLVTFDLAWMGLAASSVLVVPWTIDTAQRTRASSFVIATCAALATALEFGAVAAVIARGWSGASSYSHAADATLADVPAMTSQLPWRLGLLMAVLLALAAVAVVVLRNRGGQAVSKARLALAALAATAIAGALLWHTRTLSQRVQEFLGQVARFSDAPLIGSLELPLSSLGECPAFIDHRQRQLSGPSAAVPLQGEPIFRSDLPGDAPVRLDDSATAAYEGRLPPRDQRSEYHVYVAADRRLTFARFAEQVRPLRVCSSALIVAPPTWQGMDALGPFGALVRGFPGEGLDVVYELRQGPVQSSGGLIIGIIGEEESGRAVALRRTIAREAAVYSPVARLGELRLDAGEEAERRRAEVFERVSQSYGAVAGFLYAPQSEAPLSEVVHRMDRLMTPMCRHARQELDRIQRMGEGIHPTLTALMSQPVPWVRLTTDREGLESLIRASGSQARLD